MNTTLEQRKEKAVELMKELDIYKPYIKGFKESNHVCYFEFYGGYWAYQNPKLESKIKQIEEKYDCTVYAVTHELTSFGECYDFLIVTDYVEEWDELIYSENNKHNVYAYVWNKTDEWCSEFGTITVKSFGGGIQRIA